MKVFVASLRHIITTAGVDDALLEVGLAHVIHPRHRLGDETFDKENHYGSKLPLRICVFICI